MSILLLNICNYDTIIQIFCQYDFEMIPKKIIHFKDKFHKLYLVFLPAVE